MRSNELIIQKSWQQGRERGIVGKERGGGFLWGRKREWKRRDAGGRWEVRFGGGDVEQRRGKGGGGKT